MFPAEQPSSATLASRNARRPDTCSSTVLQAVCVVSPGFLQPQYAPCARHRKTLHRQKHKTQQAAKHSVHCTTRRERG